MKRFFAYWAFNAVFRSTDRVASNITRVSEPATFLLMLLGLIGLALVRRRLRKQPTQP